MYAVNSAHLCEVAWMSGTWHTEQDLNEMFRGKVVAKVVARESHELKLVFTDGTALVTFTEVNGSLGYAQLPDEDYPNDDAIARVKRVIEEELRKAQRQADTGIVSGLVQPYRLSLPTAWGTAEQVWVVFREPGRDGYSIVFDERGAQFGLATSGKIIGFYGAFLTIFDGM
jgi:hypothetical protein